MVRRFTFPRTSRLLRGWQFDLVFRTGRRAKGQLVRLLFVEAPDGTTRIGAAVGKRQGKAYVRSKGRRVIRESVRRLLPWTRQGIWIVVLLGSRGVTSGAREIYQDMARLFMDKGFLSPDFPGPEWDPGED